jgi:hypothetical protein
MLASRWRCGFVLRLGGPVGWPAQGAIPIPVDRERRQGLTYVIGRGLVATPVLLRCPCGRRPPS